MFGFGLKRKRREQAIKAIDQLEDVIARLEVLERKQAAAVEPAFDIEKEMDAAILADCYPSGVKKKASQDGVVTYHQATDGGGWKEITREEYDADQEPGAGRSPPFGHSYGGHIGRSGNTISMPNDGFKYSHREVK